MLANSFNISYGLRPVFRSTSCKPTTSSLYFSVNSRNLSTFGCLFAAILNVPILKVSSLTEIFFFSLTVNSIILLP